MRQNDEKQYSERDLILAKREAFKDAVRYVAENGVKSHEPGVGCPMCDKQAADRYPLPKVTRPRVLREPDSAFEVRYVDGHFEHRSDEKSGWWRSTGYDSVAVNEWRVRAWADLLANPTELVDADA